MANITIVANGFKAKFNFEYNKSFEHFCTAQELYDVAIEWLTYEKRWEEYKNIEHSQVPHWFKNKVMVSICERLLSIFDEYDETQYLIGNFHVGEDSSWSYHNKSEKMRWLFERISANSMLIDDTNDMELRMFMMNYDSLVEARDYALRDCDVPIVAPPEPEPVAAGITLEMLTEYMRTM